MTESIDMILSLGNETQVILALSNRVTKKIQETGYTKINAADRTFYCVYWLEAEINNGGFDQYFFNSAGDYALDTVKALQDIGAHYTAALLQNAFKIFPGTQPATDRSTRQEQLDEIGDESEEFFSNLDEKFMAYTEPIGTLLIEYVKKHKDQF